MAGNRKTNRYNSGKGNEGKLAQTLDDLAEFDTFRADILPKLRKMIENKTPAEEIYAFAQSYMAARAVTIGVSSRDEKNALSAIKEVLDRGVGKPADRMEITQKYEKLSEAELESLLASQEQDLQDDATH